jgi:ferredoxin
MIVTEQKDFKEILAALKDYKKIFLVGCGECATYCKTGGKEELRIMQEKLEREGKTVMGSIVPGAPCVAAQVKTELAKKMSQLRQVQAILVLACGLGVQTVKENNRLGTLVFTACNSLFGATLDSSGNFHEKCSLCSECVLNLTCGSCPVTLCPKAILNGPCSGVNKGKCEVDKDLDCVWITIYQESAKNGKLDALREIQKPKDFKKLAKPRKLIFQPPIK